MEFDGKCSCPDPQLCIRLNKHISGRLWDIWNGINVDPIAAKEYRDLWQRQASMPRPKTADIKNVDSKGCNCNQNHKSIGERNVDSKPKIIF